MSDIECIAQSVIHVSLLHSSVGEPEVYIAACQHLPSSYLGNCIGRFDESMQEYLHYNALSVCERCPSIFCKLHRPHTNSACALAIPEVTELVLTVLQTDTSSLKLCPLVCKAWAALTARHLSVTLAFDPGSCTRSPSDEEVMRPVHS